ncbi:malonyl-CoA decarboxylase [Roseicyclus sp.]|uniref:malonyl-CoA decarboxylase n=1 Tax=Roseicyclus sp. TaxID=1914329 RepID=UPI003F6C7D51
MGRSWALGDLLSTLFERRAAPFRTAGKDPLPDLCRALMSGRGEVSGMKLAGAALARWRVADDAERRAFFRYLADDLDLDPEALQSATQSYQATRGAEELHQLLRAAEPPRQELLRRLNQAVGGTVDLVAMRVALLDAARQEPDLARVDLDFGHLFASWFNRGFLVLRRIDWDSPAALLERLIAYEAVHEIQSWDDLRRRVAPTDRRCFAFFHPALPDDPLIFVQVALTRGIPSAIGPILAEDRISLAPAQADTAVFYSISNCQAGLRGISFGNSLIKQVLEVLNAELPQLSTFVTLLPIPGLARWISEQTEQIAAKDPQAQLRALAARYLLQAKAPDGQPRDPVARFHLDNGAEVHAIHADADLSPRGMAQSHGAMVNYRYDPARVEDNHETYATAHEIVAARDVRNLVH